MLHLGLKPPMFFLPSSPCLNLSWWLVPAIHHISLFPRNARGFLTFVPHLLRVPRQKKKYHLMLFQLHLPLFSVTHSLLCLSHPSASFTPAFLTHLDNFPWFLLTSSAITFIHFAFLISFYTLWTLFPNPLPSLCSWCLMPHICLFLTFDYFFFHLFIHIVDSLIAKTACQMTPGFMLIIFQYFSFPTMFLISFPYFSPCAFTWPLRCPSEMHCVFGNRTVTMNATSSLICITCSSQSNMRSTRCLFPPRKCVHENNPCKQQDENSLPCAVSLNQNATQEVDIL